MQKRLLVLIAVCFACCFTLTARAQDTVQIFGGYSYIRSNLPITTFPPIDVDSNLNGWEFSGTYNMYEWLGATADFTGDYGSARGSSLHLQTYLFGPQVHAPGPVSPFAHVLFGVAHESLGGSDIVAPSSGNAFAFAAGVGIDVRLVPLVSLRAIQLDYLVTRFGSATQNDARVSAGFVIHF
jgi:hypothetical protein